MPKGIYIRTEETKRKLSEAKMGKKHPMSEKTKKKISESNKGKTLGVKKSKEFCIYLKKITKQRMSDKKNREKISESCKKNGVGKWMKGRKIPKEVLEKIQQTRKERGIRTGFEKGHITWNKGKKMPIGFVSPNKGENNWNWKGGISPFRKTCYFSYEYKQWRKLCFERDNYTCKVCGISCKSLQVHHIKPWSLFPEFRYDINNGQTLCKECHIKTDTYGNKKIYNMRRLTIKKQ